MSVPSNHCFALDESAVDHGEVTIVTILSRGAMLVRRAFSSLSLGAIDENESVYGHHSDIVK